MYCRPMTVMFRDLPLGGSLGVLLAYSSPLSPTRFAPAASELGGFWI